MPQHKPLRERYVLSPIVYSEIWKMYKQHVASFWTAEEIDLSDDATDFKTLSPQEQKFIKGVLAFFAGSDGIVLENLATRFMSDTLIPEARCFYGFQIAMENIHAETYALLIEQLIVDVEEREHLFRALDHVSTIQQKVKWALTYMHSDRSYAERLIAFAAVEGIFFSGSFCAIYWLKKRGLMPGLCFSNELISRDEGLHRDFAILMYETLRRPLKESVIHKIIDEAVLIEIEFIRDVLPVSLIGIDADQMMQYIQYVADHLLASLRVTRLYHVDNPFEWMELISLQRKTNFFEQRVSEYQKARIMNQRKEDVFTLDADF